VIKRLLLVAALMAAFFMPAQARMFPTEIPIQVICFDSFPELLAYHKDILGEHPIGRGMIPNPHGPTFATILVNPTKPSWTFVHFHQNAQSGKTLGCAITTGIKWEVIIPDFGNEELEL